MDCNNAVGAELRNRSSAIAGVVHEVMRFILVREGLPGRLSRTCAEIQPTIQIEHMVVAMVGGYVRIINKTGRVPFGNSTSRGMPSDERTDASGKRMEECGIGVSTR